MLKFAGLLENSFVDWDGKLSAVLFLPGCNFRCGFCHNPELVTPSESLELRDEDFVLSRLDSISDWVDGVVITGGEPTIHSGLPSFIARLKERFPVKLDTNGTNPAMLKQLLDAHLLDYVAMDVKSSLESYPKAVRAEADVSKIKESISILKASSINYELRTTAVPGIHDRQEFEKIAALVKGCKRYVLQGFGPKNCLEPSFSELRPLPPEALRAFRDQMIALGIPAVVR